MAEGTDQTRGWFDVLISSGQLTGVLIEKVCARATPARTRAATVLENIIDLVVVEYKVYKER